MNESREQIITSKFEELKKNLKINTDENSWQDDLIKELKATSRSYKIYRIIGLIFMGGAGIMLILGFVAEGETIFGILIKEKYYSIGLLIIMIATIFSSVGKLELKKDRIKTFLLLKDLIK